MTTGDILEIVDEDERPLSWRLVEVELERLREGAEKTPEWQYDILAMRMAPNQEDRGPWGTRYGPRVTMTDDQGRKVERPARDDLNSSVIEHWQLRARTCRHPYLRYRFADLCWDLSQLVTKRRDVFFARVAVESVIEGLGGGSFATEVEAYQAAQRAIRLGRAIRDKNLQQRAELALVAYERTTGQDALPGTWGQTIELVASGDSLLSAENQSAIITDMETRLGRLTQKPAETAMEAFAVEAATLPLARLYWKGGRNNDLHRVLELYAAAFVSAGRSNTGSVAVSWLTRVHATLEHYGMNAEAAALTTELQEQGLRSLGEMKSFHQTLRISTEDMDRFVDRVLMGEPAEVLAHITNSFVPDPARTERQVLEAAQQAPFFGDAPKAVVNADGHEVAFIGDVEQDLEGNVVYYTTRILQFWAVPLAVVLDRARDRGVLRRDVIMALVGDCPVFDRNKHPLIEAGVEHYLTGDYVAAIHLLIPQIEAAARRLAALAGGAPYRRNETKQRLEPRSLEGLLADPGVKAALGGNVASYLSIVLADARGWGLRNDVCHGGLGAEALGKVQADRVLHCFLQFLWIRYDHGART